MSVYTIKPLDVGHFSDLDKPVFTYMRGFREVICSPIVMWAIEGQKERILVDTGPGNPDRALKFHNRILHQKDSQQPANALAGIGWNPEDISLVILTHLHWDHCGNNHLFKRAQFIVQEEEVRYAISPFPVHCMPYETPVSGTSPLWLETLSQLTIIRGDGQVAPGVSTVHLPGHTPGFQGVLVETKSGPFLIAGDSIPLYENWQGSGHEKHIPSGIHTDLHSCYRTFEKIEQMGAVVLPGHDMRVFDRPVYP